MAAAPNGGERQQPQIQPCRYKVGKTLGAGSYSVVKECVHIDTGRYYAAKVINKRLMAGREHMVRSRFSSLTHTHSALVAFLAKSGGLTTIPPIVRCATRSLCSRRYPWDTRTS